MDNDKQFEIDSILLSGKELVQQIKSSGEIDTVVWDELRLVTENLYELIDELIDEPFDELVN